MMEYVISFFRDTLNGPVYIIVSIIAGILICSCIGYLAEQSELKKKQKKEYDNTHASVTNNNSNSISSEVKDTNLNVDINKVDSLQQPVTNINPTVNGVISSSNGDLSQPIINTDAPPIINMDNNINSSNSNVN